MASDFQEVTELMKTMGSKEGFDPMPPDQYRWQGELDGNPLLYRLWSKMCSCTVGRGRRSPYAVDRRGKPIDIEGMAKLLDEDPGNVRYAWRQGVARGLWRNGTKAEGGSRLLFLSGRVVATEATDAAEATNGTRKKVYTHRLRPYLIDQINRLAESDQNNFWDEFNGRHEKRDRSLAYLVAAHRVIDDKDDDTQFQKYGIKKIRETHRTKEPPEEVEARQLCIQMILPEIEKFVHTVEEMSVQPSAEASVHTNGAFVQQKGAGASLLCSEQSRDKDPSSSSLGTPQTTTTTSSFTPSEPEQDWVLEAMEKWCGEVEPIMAQRLLTACRAKVPDITDGEICDYIHDVGKTRRGSIEKADSPPAYLTTAVTNKLSPESLAKRRAQKRGGDGQAKCTCGTFPHAAGCAKFAAARGASGDD